MATRRVLLLVDHPLLGDLLHSTLTFLNKVAVRCHLFNRSRRVTVGRHDPPTLLLLLGAEPLRTGRVVMGAARAVDLSSNAAKCFLEVARGAHRVSRLVLGALGLGLVAHFLRRILRLLDSKCVRIRVEVIDRSVKFLEAIRDFCRV